jgi:peptide/nickel transport system substrate-binding protein
MKKALLGCCLPNLILLLFVSACKHATPTDELVVAIGAAPATLDPRLATDAYGMRIGLLVFNALVRVGPDIQAEADAARTWTLHDLTYTFELWPGLKFHNGRTLTADDVLFSFDEFRSDHSNFRSATENIASVMAIDLRDHVSVKITLKRYKSNFLTGDLPIIKLMPRAESLSGQLLGSGSYRIVETSESEVRLAAITPHPILAPLMPKLTFKIIHDDFTRFQKLAKGEIDLVINELSPEKVSVFQKRPDQFRVYTYDGLSMTYLLVNLSDPTLQQKPLREALSRAINRRELIKYKLEGLAHEATSILQNSHPYFNHELANPTFNITAARQIIESLDLVGKTLTLKSSNNPAVIDHGRVLAYQLSKSGLRIDLQSFEWGKYYDDIKRGNFQLALMKWTGVFDADIYRNAFHSHELPPGRNRGRYINAQLDPLLEKAAFTEDEGARKKLYLQIQKIVFDDYAILPLWYEEQVAVMAKKVNGFVPSLNGDFRPLLKVVKSTL